MRKFYIAFIFTLLCICFKANAQQLVLDTSWTSFPDTVVKGTAVTIKYKLQNTDSNKYFGTITTWYKTNFYSPPKAGDSITLNIAGNATVLISATIYVTDTNYFKLNKKNIVVIWPTGTGTKIQLTDSLRDNFLLTEFKAPNLSVNGKLKILPDTVRYGDSVNARYTILNTGNANYNGPVKTFLRSDINSTPLQIDSTTVNIPAGDSALISVNFNVNNPYFKENSNGIVVIWPTGTGTFISSQDSLTKKIFVEEQPKPEFDSVDLKGIPDTILYGNTVNISYKLINKSVTEYTDSVFTWLKTDLHPVPVRIRAEKVTVQDSFTINASFKAEAPYFKENVKSIVVIWPTGTGTIIRFNDTARRDMFVAEHPKPQFDSGSLEGIPDSVIYGSNINIKYRLLNTSPTNYNDSVITWLKTDLFTTPLRIGASKINLDDTLSIFASFIAQAPYFQENIKSIVVIWPTGTGTIIKVNDTAKTGLRVDENVSIKQFGETLNYVRFYPNPAKDFLRYAYMQPYVFLTRIYVTDMLGRKQEIQPDKMNNSIDVSSLPQGVYIFTLEFNNKKSASYKVIKSK